MKTTRENGTLVVALEGKLDSITAPELAECIQGEAFQELIIDLTELSYISSAGLRALLISKKKADKSKASMMVKHPCAAVLEVMKMSGFTKILTIQES